MLSCSNCDHFFLTESPTVGAEKIAATNLSSPTSEPQSKPCIRPPGSRNESESLDQVQSPQHESESSEEALGNTYKSKVEEANCSKESGDLVQNLSVHEDRTTFRSLNEASLSSPDRIEPLRESGDNKEKKEASRVKEFSPDPMPIPSVNRPSAPESGDIFISTTQQFSEAESSPSVAEASSHDKRNGHFGGKFDEYTESLLKTRFLSQICFSSFAYQERLTPRLHCDNQVATRFVFPDKLLSGIGLSLGGRQLPPR